MADMRVELDALEARFPGLKATLEAESVTGHRPMPAFEAARESRIVGAINRAYFAVRGVAQPTGAITPPGFYTAPMRGICMRRGDGRDRVRARRAAEYDAG
jgi:acetylornithine deacetylase